MPLLLRSGYIPHELRRGLGPAALLVVSTWPAGEVLAGMPPSLVIPTVKAATLVAAGERISAVVPAGVTALTEGVLTSMFRSKLKAALVVIVIALGLGTGLGLTTGMIGNPARALEEKGHPAARKQPKDGPAQQRFDATAPVTDQAKQAAGDVRAAVKTDADRAAAEWVLSVGGVIYTDKGYVSNRGQLPDKPFRITGIKLESYGNSDRVKDEDLERFKDLTNLKLLDLNWTRVTDAGLKHLKGLTNLESLGLRCCKVTDAGLEHLKGLTILEYLELDETAVTDAGLKHLKGLTELLSLELFSTTVSDAGLEHLKGLKNLQRLTVSRTKVTEAGFKKLQQALPDLGRRAMIAPHRR